MTTDTNRIYEELRNKIIQLELRPGTRLSETEISKIHGISRTPIRDILKKLEYDGLLEIVAQKGNYVSKIDLSALNDYMYIRSRVDRGVLMDLCESVSAGDIAVLEGIIRVQKAIINDIGTMSDMNIATRFFANDNEFHLTIYKMAGKESVWHLINNLCPPYSRFRYVTYLRDESNLSNLFQSHNKIIEILRNKDLTAIKMTIEGHTFSGYDGIKKVQTEHKDYFL